MDALWPVLGALAVLVVPLLLAWWWIGFELRQPRAAKRKPVRSDEQTKR
jgi:hypothetical protein